MNKIEIKYLDKIKSPKDLDELNDEQLKDLATELRYDVTNVLVHLWHHILGQDEPAVVGQYVLDELKDP